MTQMVNVLGAKTELGSPMICSYLLNLPDHYTNHKFVTFYWKSFVSEVKNRWREVHEPAEDVKISLRKRRGTIMGVSPMEDYIHRPLELASWSLYDWICLCDRAPNSTVKRNRSNKDGDGPLILECEWDTDDDNIKDNGDSCGSGDEPLSPCKSDNAGSLKDFIVDSDATDDDIAFDTMDCSDPLPKRVKYVHDASDSDDAEDPTKKRNGCKTKIRRLKFAEEHPMYETYHVAVHPEEM